MHIIVFIHTHTHTVTVCYINYLKLFSMNPKIFYGKKCIIYKKDLSTFEIKRTRGTFEILNSFFFFF